MEIYGPLPVWFGALLIAIAFSTGVDGKSEVVTWAMAERILDQIEEPGFPDRDFIITDFGAKSGGETDSRPALIKAIARCNRTGGGRIIVPEGLWFCKGPIHLKSNINLHLEEGATIRFSEDMNDFLPVVLTRWAGTECYNYSPYIYCWQGTNVAITGKGTLDGNAKNSFPTWKKNEKPDVRLLWQMGNNGFPVHKRIFGKGHWLRTPMVEFFGCKNVLVEGVTVIDAPFWVIHPVYCKNVIVRGVTVDSLNDNNDGVGLDSSVNVLVEDCVFNVGDDAVVIKSGRDEDGWRVGQASENIIIRNCIMSSDDNGLAIGSEMSGGVRYVFMENCRMGDVESAIYFKSNLDRGGVVEHIRVRNIEINRTTRGVIHFMTDYSGWRGNHHPPVYRDFVIEDITCKQADNYGINAVGKEGEPIRDVLIRNVQIEEAKVPQHLSFVENFSYENVRVNGEFLQPNWVE